MAEDVYDQGKLLSNIFVTAYLDLRQRKIHAIILPGLASRAAGIAGHV